MVQAGKTLKVVPSHLPLAQVPVQGWRLRNKTAAKSSSSSSGRAGNNPGFRARTKQHQNIPDPKHGWENKKYKKKINLFPAPNQENSKPRNSSFPPCPSVALLDSSGGSPGVFQAVPEAPCGIPVVSRLSSRRRRGWVWFSAASPWKLLREQKLSPLSWSHHAGV